MTGAGGSTSCNLVAAGSCIVNIPIIPDNGQASAVKFSGFVAAQASGSIISEIGITSPVANYSDTAVVNSLLLVDENGVPIQGAVISSASGTDYNHLQQMEMTNVTGKLEVSLAPLTCPQFPFT